MISTGLAFALIVAALAVGIGLGMHLATLRRAGLVEEAADAAVDELVARQTADDRTVLASLPPGVEAADALELADRRGISLREASLVLFRDQARARIAANLDRHHPASRSKRRA